VSLIVSGLVASFCVTVLKNVGNATALLSLRLWFWAPLLTYRALKIPVFFDLHVFGDLGREWIIGREEEFTVGVKGDQ
jgi:hypothetical protein